MPARKMVRSVCGSARFAAQEASRSVLDLRHELRQAWQGTPAAGAGAACGAAGAADCEPRRSWACPLVWTNLLLLGPAALYWQAGCVMCAAMLLGSFAASVCYHWHHERHHGQLVVDKLMAIGAFCATLPQTAGSLSGPGLLLAAAIVACSFWCKGRAAESDYRTYHSLWHGLVAAGQLFLACHL